MTKLSKKTKTTPEQSILATRPWVSSSFGRQAEIDGFNPTTGTWDTIATVNSIAGIDAEDIAALIVEAVAAYQAKQ